MTIKPNFALWSAAKIIAEIEWLEWCRHRCEDRLDCERRLLGEIERDLVACRAEQKRREEATGG